MTVGQKLHMCLAQIESAHASLKSFALDTQDQNAKTLYSQCANVLESQVLTPLKTRVNQVEAEEPTYKVYQQAQQQQPQTTVRR